MLAPPASGFPAKNGYSPGEKIHHVYIHVFVIKGSYLRDGCHTSRMMMHAKTGFPD